jgi:isopenicillin N synthase-like dioxygenase
MATDEISKSTSSEASPPLSISIPTVNLDDADVAITFRTACRDVGFMYLVGHGLTKQDIDKVFLESKNLFMLPTTVKESLADKTMSRGYTAMEEETLDPKGQTQGDTKEGYYIGREIPTSSSRYDPAKLRGPNQWPDKETLPDFRSTMESYHTKVSEVAMRLVRLLAQTLDLPPSHFDDDFSEPVATLRLLHYAQRQSQPEQGIYACGAHSDYGILTLLLTDEHPGLQILHQGEWIDVPPKPDAFVVNIGDMLEIWTNGQYKSTVHRVLTSAEYERYSIPFFFDPKFETVVECLPTCTDSNNPPRYPPTTAGQHLVSKYEQTHADFAPPADETTT